METLLTIAAVAARLSCSERTVRNYIRESLLPASKLPGKRRWYIREEDLDRLIRAGARPTEVDVETAARKVVRQEDV